MYEQQVLQELRDWQRRMQRKPNVMDRLSKAAQTKVNSYIPEKVHAAITRVIRDMVRGVLFGAKYVSGRVRTSSSLEQTEAAVRDRIDWYKKAGAAEGGITGAGGLLMGLADFPILMTMKLKMLFDIATLYGYDVRDYRERIYLLHIFQLAFSSQQHRREVYFQMENWSEKCKLLPEDLNQFNWRPFQQEYRDYIDLAKMAQLIPGIGAVVGFVVNYRLLKKLGETAMNAYRMRWAETKLSPAAGKV